MIDPTNSFRIDPVKGTLILTNPAVLDREKNSDVIGNLEVGTLEKVESEIPEERRKAMRGSRVLIRINVIDENDNAPMFVPCESVKYVYYRADIFRVSECFIQSISG